MEKIKICCTGFSRRGKDLAKCAHADSDFEITAVCDLDEIRKKEAAGMLGEKVHFYTDYNEMLKKEKPDAVTIATPQYNHRDLAIRAFENKIHVYCEKPLAMNLAQCDEMISASEKAGCVFIVGQQMRYHFHLHKAWNIIAGGEIGKPAMIWLKEFRGPFRVSPEHMWIFDQEKSGGMLVEKSCHHFDLFNWFAGSRPVSVYASAGLDGLDNVKNFKCTINDNAWVIVNYENGARAMLGLCMFLGKPDRAEGTIGFHRREIGVAGEKGILHTEGYLPAGNIEIHYADSHNLIRYELKKEGTIPNKFNQEGNKGIFMDFAECIREKKKPFASGEIGRMALAVSLAAEKSCAEKRIVQIDEL